MKKIWVFFLSIITTLLVWVSFADIIRPNTHRVDRCVKISNPHGIHWYKLIVRRDEFSHGIKSYSVYDVVENECLEQFPQWWSSRSSDFPYLVDKDIDISTLNNLPLEEFESKLWKFYKLDKINPNDKRVSNSNPITNETLTYKIVKNWKNYELKPIESWWNTTVDSSTIVRFLTSRIISIEVETLILFIIAELFRKKDQITNKKLILFWVLPTIITLPLLWFVLPLIIWSWERYIIIWELLVTIVEAVIIKYWLKISRWKAILASIVCNLSSFIVWLIIFNNIF